MKLGDSVETVLTEMGWKCGEVVDLSEHLEDLELVHKHIAILACPDLDEEEFALHGRVLLLHPDKKASIDQFMREKE